MVFDIMVEINKEEKMITDFINNNPYPSYEEMEDIIINSGYSHKLDFAAEYSRYSHNALKLIYENPHDKVLIHRMGQSIFERYDFQTLQMNFYVIKLLSPVAKSKDIEIRCAFSLVEHYWNGIGSWIG